MVRAHYNNIPTYCKECWKTRVKAHRLANLEVVQKYDRERGQLPHRKAAVKARAYRYKDRSYYGKEKDPIKRHARVVVGNAIRDGTLLEKPCERCGKTKGVHAHHEDHTKPLAVTWLCSFHHGERHREINTASRARG
jgi:hypothetical protein